MRRLGDLLAVNYPGRVFVMSMPRSVTNGALQSLVGELLRLEEWLKDCAPSGATTSDHQAAPPVTDYPAPVREGGVFVVAGPLSDDSLLRLLTHLGAGGAGLESCTSPDRWRPLATDTFATNGDDLRGPDRLTGLASRLLEIGMCPRRSALEREVYLARRLDETQPSSVIYARQSFCDPGAYDALLVARLAAERNLPYLEIEVGFPFDATGPLRTRVEAFLEAQLLDEDLLAGEPGNSDGALLQVED